MIKVTKNGIILRGRIRHILIVCILLLLIFGLIKGIMALAGALFFSLCRNRPLRFPAHRR